MNKSKINKTKNQMRRATNALWFATAGARVTWNIVGENLNHSKVRVRIDGNRDELLKGLIENQKSILEKYGVKITGANTLTGLLIQCQVVAE
ncbi:MAG: hypothetical protein P1Q69_10540 [Candidatus Thorarchaeota archaeon]|nr:hypothetical protein [Candidatus Thorarchaeota archaeon]